MDNREREYLRCSVILDDTAFYSATEVDQRHILEQHKEAMRAKLIGAGADPKTIIFDTPTPLDFGRRWELRGRALRLPVEARILQQARDYLPTMRRYPIKIILSPELYTELRRSLATKCAYSGAGHSEAGLCNLRYFFSFGDCAVIELGGSVLGDKIVFVYEKENGLEFAKRFLAGGCYGAGAEQAK